MAKVRAQTVATNFLLRLLVCIFVLGGIYLIFFNPKAKSHNKPLTTVQKVANIKSLIDQTYISSNQIAKFNQSTVAGTYNLGNLIATFNSSLTSLTSAANTAPKLISSSLKSNINQIITEGNDVKSAYQTANSVLGQVISYDPSSDLSLSLPANNSTLSSRLQAAISGMNTAANSQTTLSNTNNLSVQSDNGNLVVNNEARLAILSSANCLKVALAQLNSNASSNTVSSSINACILAYPSTRLTAIKNELNDSFNSSYTSSIKGLAVPTVSDLAAIVTQNTPKTGDK